MPEFCTFTPLQTFVSLKQCDIILDPMRYRLYLLVVFVFFMHDLFSQCAMCKAVAADEVEEEGETGINVGILYIMVIPYIILFFVFRKKVFGFLKDLRKATGSART